MGRATDLGISVHGLGLVFVSGAPQEGLVHPEGQVHLALSQSLHRHLTSRTPDTNTRTDTFMIKGIKKMNAVASSVQQPDLVNWFLAPLPETAETAEAQL